MSSATGARARRRGGCCAATAIVLAGSLSPSGVLFADLLHDNGAFITAPAGGTGAIAGQPISQADPFTVPGSSFVFSTTGVAATVATSTAAAEDFTVPAGETWDLDRVTLFAFQTSQTSPTITAVRINLWAAPPHSAGSPAPLPDPLPAPVLREPIVVDAGTGIFVAHRQGATGTGTVRPVFAYTVSLNDLPDGGLLNAGTYWLEWAFEGAASPSANVFMPLVSPRDQIVSPSIHNARLLNALNSADTRDWFEGREGYVAGQSEGRAYSLPFVLEGARTATPICLGDFDGSGDVTLQDLFDFLSAFFAGQGRADINNSGDVTLQDVFDYLTHFFGGC